MELLPTQIGPYQIGEELERGRQVLVFEAYDLLYERPVALRVFPPYLAAAHPNDARNFVSEGREAMRLRHAHIVATYDAGLADGYYYVAHALAPGGTLAAFLENQPAPLPLEHSLKLLQNLSQGLDYAHKLGVVHNNIDPSNILLTEGSQPLLANFDLVGRRSEEGQKILFNGDLTRLSYLSPEQARGAVQATLYSDIYKLGVLAYHLLTGTVPFAAENELALLHAIGTQSPQRPSALNSLLNEAVDHVLLRALEKDALQRWPSAGALAQALAMAWANKLPLTVLVPADAETGGDGEQAEESAAADSKTRDASSADHTVAFGVTIRPAVVQPSRSEPSKATPLVSALQRLPAPKYLRSRERSAREKVALSLAGIVVSIVALALLLATGMRFFGGGNRLVTLFDRNYPTQNVEPVILDNTSPNPEEGLTPPKPTPEDENRSDPSAAESDASSPFIVTNWVPVPMMNYGGTDVGFRLSVPADAEIRPEKDGIHFSFPDLPVEFALYEKAWWGEEKIDPSELATYVETNVFQDWGLLDDHRLVRTDDEALLQNRLQLRWQGEVEGRLHIVRLHTNFAHDSLFLLISRTVEADSGSLNDLIDTVFASFQILEPLPLAALAPTVTDTPAPLVVVQPTFTPTQIVNTADKSKDPADDLSTQVQFAVAEDFERGSLSERAQTKVVDEDTVQPLQGRIAYALWNPVTSGMDTYIYTLGVGFEGLPLLNKRQPDFRHDGWLAFNGIGDGVDNIVRTHLGGENAVVISAHPEDSRPHWAPDGKKFVFDSTFMGDREQRIYLSNDIDEKEDERPVELRPLMYNFYELFGRYPVFVTNQLIAYNGCNVWENGGSCGIYRVGLSGGEPLQSTSWPNDFPTDNLGSQILFMSERDSDGQEDNWDVYVVNSDGTNLRRLTQHPAHDGLATASPDGEYIAFVSDREGSWSVYVMRSDGSDIRKLFSLNGRFGPGTQYWEYDWKQERLSWGN